MMPPKLAHQTGFAVLICSLGGLILAIGLGRGLSSIERNTRELGINSVALRDINHLKSSMNQWFITIDLVFADGQTYLAEGIAEQGHDLSQVLSSLSETHLGKQAQEPIAEAQERIDEISGYISASSLWSPDERDTKLNGMINASDTAAIALINLLDKIESQLKDGSSQAVSKLDTQRANFQTTATVLGSAFLLLIFGVWRWTTVGVVRPVVDLTRAASNAAASIEAFDIQERGPREIRQLARDIHSFVTDLDAARRRADDQRMQANEAANRVQAIMGAAPDAIFTVDPDGRIATFNQAARTLFGLSDAALTGHDTEALIPGYLQALKGEAILNATAAEVTAHRGDGTPFPADLSISEVTLGGATHHTAVLRDTTRRKQREAEVKRLNEQLVETGRQAGMAEIASGVLHNVGNVLTSVNVAATSLREQISSSKTSGLHKAVTIMNDHADDLPGFIAYDPKGQNLLNYLSRLASVLNQEHDILLDDVGGLIKHIEHIKEVIRSQQAFAKVQGLTQPIKVSELFNDALEVNATRLKKFSVVIDFQIDDDRTLSIDRHKALQILVNLVKNACDAMAGSTHAETNEKQRRLILSANRLGDEFVRLSISDTGGGIAPENLKKIFNHGFTTKPEGHGFGLHSSANTAQQMGGALTAQSEGIDMGATFYLDLPVAQLEECPCLST